MHQIDAGTLRRGRDYATHRHVLRLEAVIEPDAAPRLYGLIEGSDDQPYACMIDIVDKGGRPVWKSACTCPVTTSCKHAVAMLYVASAMDPDRWPGREGVASDHEAIDDPSLSGVRVVPTNAASPWEGWLRDVARLSAPKTEARQRPAPGERQLAVMIRAEVDAASRLPRLLVLPSWLRRGARGGWVEPKALDYDAYHGPGPAPADGWPPHVVEALSVLIPAASTMAAGRHWLPITGPHLEAALVTLLAHYPMFYERGDTPLERGPTRPLQVHWKETPHGSQALVVTVDSEDPGTRILQGHGLWYLQLQPGRLGQASGQRRLAELAAAAPILHPEDAASIAPRFTTLGLPKPHTYAITEITATPTIVLRLRTETFLNWMEAASEVAIAQCSIDYDGRRISVDDPEPVIREREGTAVRILRRDAHAERRSLEPIARAGLMRPSAALAGFRPRDARWRPQQGDLLWRPDLRKPPQSLEQWAPLLDTLRAAGIRIEYAKGLAPDRIVAIDGWHGELTPHGSAWFDLALGIDVDGARIDLLPILRSLIADPTFPRTPPPEEKTDATWRVPLDAERSVLIGLARLRMLIEPLLEWLESDSTPRIHQSQAPLLEALTDPVEWHGSQHLRAHRDALAHAPKAVDPPDGFQATLRGYQREGLAWLDFLGQCGLGGILADDMGLGKTVQVLAHLLGEKLRGRLEAPALVVAPTSLVGNWRDEAQRFTPTLRVLVMHGADRTDHYEAIANYDLVITTYPLLPRDNEHLCKVPFALLILDEAQAIKNARSQAGRVVRRLQARRRLAMTGTPLENHLGELWAQMDAVEPGLLGSERHFNQVYRSPIEKHGDTARQARLNQRVAPLLLRRRKDDVLADLPPKTEIVHTLELDGAQRELYESLRLAQHERVREAVAARGLAQSGIVVLDALLKLRQVCCDPRLIKLASARKVRTSAKLEALMNLLEGLQDEGRRVLLFSQFSAMLDLIGAALEERGIAYQCLTGDTPARVRTQQVKRFQQGELPVFLISLKAGGVGLNLTAADTVIHYDPWWNPAAEAQASDRAHRIGQDKPVFVYKLICKDTVEEKILALQARKSSLAEALLDGGSSQRLRFDEGDLEALFAPSQR